MGIEKTASMTRLSPESAAHVDSIRQTAWPMLSVSQSIDLIVAEHRLLSTSWIVYRMLLAKQLLDRNRCNGEKAS